MFDKSYDIYAIYSRQYQSYLLYSSVKDALSDQKERTCLRSIGNVEDIAGIQKWISSPENKKNSKSYAVIERDGHIVAASVELV